MIATISRGKKQQQQWSRSINQKIMLTLDFQIQMPVRPSAKESVNVGSANPSACQTPVPCGNAQSLRGDEVDGPYVHSLRHEMMWSSRDHVWTAPLMQGLFDFDAAWSGASMCPACLCDCRR